MNVEYLYENKLGDAVFASMNENSRKEFPIDPRVINWEECIRGFVYGLNRYYMKEDFLSPDEGFKQLLSKNQNPYFADI